MAEPTKTLQDPVDADILKLLDRLEVARSELGIQLLENEQTRVRILAKSYEVDKQRIDLFEREAAVRGIEPNREFEIDAKTGLIQLHGEKDL